MNKNNKEFLTSVYLLSSLFVCIFVSVSCCIKCSFIIFLYLIKRSHHVLQLRLTIKQWRPKDNNNKKRQETKKKKKNSTDVNSMKYKKKPAGFKALTFNSHDYQQHYPKHRYKFIFIYIKKYIFSICIHFF